MKNLQFQISLLLIIILITAFPSNAQTWHRCKPLPIALQPAVVTANGKIYAVGQRQGFVGPASTYEYDIDQNTWTKKGDMISTRIEFELVEINNRIFAIGGRTERNISSPIVEEYDISAGIWVKKNDMPSPVFGMGILKIQGKLYVIGGILRSLVNNTIIDSTRNITYVYDPENDTWASCSNMKTPRVYPAIVNVDGKIFAFAGWDGLVSSVNSVEEYNILSDSWVQKEMYSIVSIVPYLCQASAIKEKIYVTLTTWPGETTPDTYICEYNPVTNIWIEKKHIIPIGDFRKLVINDQLYMFCGQLGVSGLSNKVLKYDPSTNTQTFLPDLSERKWFPGVTEVNGKFYVIGGSNYYNYSSRVEMLDINYDTTATGIDFNSIPEEYSLSQNYPNPFNPETAISYQVPAFNHVVLKIYDLLGREIATVVDKEQEAGNYKINFNGNNLSSGVYLYKLQIGNFSETKKMMLIR